MKKQRITGTFLMAPPLALKELSPTRFMVYAALSLRADSKTGQCYPTYERIMDDTDMSRSAIARNIKELIGLGWVTKISRGSNKTNRANRYQVHEVPEGRSATSDTKHSTASDTKYSTASDTLTENITNQSIEKTFRQPLGDDIIFFEEEVPTKTPIGDLKGVLADDDIDFGTEAVAMVDQDRTRQASLADEATTTTKPTKDDDPWDL